MLYLPQVTFAGCLWRVHDRQQESLWKAQLQFEWKDELGDSGIVHVYIIGGTTMLGSLYNHAFSDCL